VTPRHLPRRIAVSDPTGVDAGGGRRPRSRKSQMAASSMPRDLRLARWTACLLVTLAFAGTAAADHCRSGCRAQGGVCVAVAHITRLACKLACRGLATRRLRAECARQCRLTFRDAVDACLIEARVSCRQTCDGSTPCIEACGEQLDRCGKSTRRPARRCRRRCVRPPDRLACLADCATALRAGAAGCVAGLNACAAVCKSGSP